MSDFCDPIDCSLPGSSVHGPLQARILEQLPFPSPGKNTGVVAISFSRGSSQPRNQTLVSCIVGRFFTDWAMRDFPLLRRDIDNSSGVSFPILNLTFGEHLFSPKIWQNINGILAILQFLLFFKVMKYLLLKNKYVVEMWWCLVPKRIKVLSNTTYLVRGREDLGTQLFLACTLSPLFLKVLDTGGKMMSFPSQLRYWYM